MTPEQIVARYFNVEESSLVVARIKEGLTNESYRVTGADYPVVVRISNADDQSLLIDRRSEAIVLKLVEQAGIGAPVLLNLPESHILMTREISGRNLRSEEVGSRIAIRSIAALLSRLHALETLAGIQSMNLVDLLSHYWQLLGPWRDSEIALRIAAESDVLTTRCLCHRDVHYLNLIDDGRRLWLLDWEYAVIGDPCFDLASVCCYHDFNQQQRALLLESYTSLHAEEEAERGIREVSVLDMDIERLNRMCWLFDYIKELWFAAWRLAASDGLIASPSPPALRAPDD